MDETQERPLVTFVLFAYNQEKYIREAIEGAFSQTYQPLEIILSDDCSTDRTFEIMQEMAATYQGPHRVRVRQSPINKGLISHINNVIKESRTEIIVIAAGDDVSLPQRAQRHVEIFRTRHNIFAVYSDFFPYHQCSGHILLQHPAKLQIIPAIHHVMNVGGVGFGATYSYRKQCFKWPSQLPDKVVSEDRILPLRASLLGHVIKSNERLIKYRQTTQEDNLKNKKTWQKSSEKIPEHVTHVREIISHAHANGHLYLWQRLLLLNALTLSIYRLKLLNCPKKISMTIMLFICNALYIPFRIIRKLSIKNF